MCVLGARGGPAIRGTTWFVVPTLLEKHQGRDRCFSLASSLVVRVVSHYFLIPQIMPYGRLIFWIHSFSINLNLIGNIFTNYFLEGFCRRQIPCVVIFALLVPNDNFPGLSAWALSTFTPSLDMHRVHPGVALLRRLFCAFGKLAAKVSWESQVTLFSSSLPYNSWNSGHGTFGRGQKARGTFKPTMRLCSCLALGTACWGCLTGPGEGRELSGGKVKGQLAGQEELAAASMETSQPVEPAGETTPMWRACCYQK